MAVVLIAHIGIIFCYTENYLRDIAKMFLVLLTILLEKKYFARKELLCKKRIILLEKNYFARKELFC